MRPSAAPLLALLVVSACGHDSKSDPSTCEALAPIIAKCDPSTTQQDWLGLCSLTALSSECIHAIASAPCSEHASPTPSYQSTCFPPCDPASTPSVCNSDQTVTQCVQALGLIRYQCTGVCAQTNKQYSGVCGAQYQGQTSATSQPVCWCQ